MQQFNHDFDEKLRLDNFFYEERKYKILEILNSKPADLSKNIKKVLPKCLEISTQTFSNWLNASKTDSLEIPSLKLATIAAVLNTSMEELFNIQIPTPIIEIPSHKLKNEILKKSGLVL